MAVKVEPKKNSNMYGMSMGNNIWFSLASSPKEGRKQTTGWFSCRDHVNDVLIASANQQDHCYHKEKTDPPFDYDRTRLLIAAKEGAKPYIFAAKRIINIYEDLGKFSKKSVIVTTAKMSNVDAGGQSWLLTGPKEWMLCSQLTSMLTLIMRICFRAEMDLKPKSMPKNIDELDALWKKVLDDYSANKPKYSYGTWDINTALRLCYPRWRVLMENFEEIFKGLKPKDLYPEDKVGSWHGPGGIYSLCQFISRIDKLDKRFKKKCKEAGVLD